MLCLEVFLWFPFSCQLPSCDPGVMLLASLGDSHITSRLNIYLKAFKLNNLSGPGLCLSSAPRAWRRGASARAAAPLAASRAATSGLLKGVMASRPPGPHWINTRFTDGGWDAPVFAAQSAPAFATTLESLASQWTTLDAHARLGLTLSVPFLAQRRKDFSSVEAHAQALASAAMEDDAEWVRIMGRAVGTVPGRLDLDAVLAEEPKV